MYELVVIWETGERDVFGYRTEERAERAGQEMKMVFGNQISWVGVRRASCIY